MAIPIEPAGEEALIADYFAPLSQDWPGSYGLKDDCASVAPAPGHELVLKTDPVRAGVHFFDCDSPEDIAWKALAVNVSDLAAKSAMPLAYLLAISFPEKPEQKWLQGFSDGLRQAQEAFGCTLIGGDTDRADGPLSIAVTVIGELPVGRMVQRGTAAPGDQLYVTGTLGDAALGLQLHANAEPSGAWSLTNSERDFLRQRYHRPQPRLHLKRALRYFASAAMDISDGLAKDLTRMCRASGTGAEVQLDDLPRSTAMQHALEIDPGLIEKMIAAGDDYEVLVAVPPKKSESFEAAVQAATDFPVSLAGLPSMAPVTRIGKITAGGNVRFYCATGQEYRLQSMGYDHFRPSTA